MRYAARVKECAYAGCSKPRLTSNRGRESYCREHKNEMARLTRHAGREPEVVTTVECARLGCTETFEVSSWGQPRRFCSETCRKGAPKEERAHKRVERQQLREREKASTTERRCPGLPARGDSPAEPCGVRPVAEFYMIRGNFDTLCKDHRKAQQRRYEQAHPETRRETKRLSQRRARYAKISYEGRPMTEADVAVEMERQGGVCAISPCQRPATDVDHDHATSQFRGILCRKDNIKLHHDDTVEWLLAAADYLGRGVLQS